MKVRHVIFGLATHVPGVLALNQLRTGTGGTDSARYCYSIWMRHLLIAARNHLCDQPPPVVAEIGPGDSIGIGLAALISGSQEYYGFDLVRYVNLSRNLTIFDELVALFAARAGIPDDLEFPDAKPKLASYDFPHTVLPQDHLQRCLAADRLERLKWSIRNPGARGSAISYMAPWQVEPSSCNASVDMILSQAVMEHVDDIRGAYTSMHAWLRPGGFVSHQIDFRSHGTSSEWNGHWACSDALWRLIRGRRPFLLNRQPFSAHVAELERCGFTIVHSARVHKESGIDRARLAPRFADLTNDDLTTSGALIQARRQ